MYYLGPFSTIHPCTGTTVGVPCIVKQKILKVQRYVFSFATEKNKRVSRIRANIHEVPHQKQHDKSKKQSC